MMSQTRLRVRVTVLGMALGVVLGVLGACQSGYSVELRNESGRPVVASVVRGGAFDGERTLAQKRIPSGSTGELGPFEWVGMGGVRVSVRRPGDLGALATETRLRRGLNIFVVEAGGVDSWEAAVLRRVE